MFSILFITAFAYAKLMLLFLNLWGKNSQTVAKVEIMFTTKNFFIHPDL